MKLFKSFTAACVMILLLAGCSSDKPSESDNASSETPADVVSVVSVAEDFEQDSFWSEGQGGTSSAPTHKDEAEWDFDDNPAPSVKPGVSSSKASETAKESSVASTVSTNSGENSFDSSSKNVSSQNTRSSDDWTPNY